MLCQRGTLLKNSFVLREINTSEHEVAPKAGCLKRAKQSEERYSNNKTGHNEKISAHLCDPEYLIHPYV